MFNIFCEIDGVNIPLVSTGTSPFIGAGQFGYKAFEWQRKFLNNPKAILEILEASYTEGARGIEVIPIGKIGKAALTMSEIHSDYVITGSTYPDKNSGIDNLVKIGAKLIFVHGMVSDVRGGDLVNLLDQIASNGIIPGVATHDPIPTLKYCIENSLNVKAFLIPFNASGRFMDNQLELEKIVDNNIQYSFIGMKTLAAGKLNPKDAYDYISKHNICAVSIGMVSSEEAKESTSIALKILSKN